MSESQFIEDKVRSFRRRYPARAGWFVCRASHLMGMDLLPALLGLRAIEAQVDNWFRVGLHEGQRGTVINSRGPVFVKRGPGLSDIDWFGTVRFPWKGTPIVIERHSLEPGGLSSHEVTLAATKDRSAIEDLGKTLCDFWRKTTSSERDVLVLNGGGLIELPKLGWEDLVLADGMAAEIRGNVEAFLSAQAHYRKLRLPYRRGFLFVGPPGGGKTTAAKIILANAKARPLLLSLQGDLKDSTVESAFREAANHPPAILLIEDLDKMIQSKDVSMSCLLNLLDGLDTYEGFLLIATSNEPEKIDKALLHRPSRFDRVWHFGLPGPEERRRLLALRSQGKFSDHAIAQAAEATAGFMGAYVQETIVSAMLQALHQGREPADADLLAMTKRLQEQYRTTKKASGAIPEAQAMGFLRDGGE